MTSKYQHSDVEKISVEGEIFAEDLWRHKEEIIKAVEDSMRDAGIVPLLDITPHWTQVYDFERDLYKFTLSVFGVKGENAWEPAGVYNGRPLQRSIPSPK